MATYKPTVADVLNALGTRVILKGELVREIANRHGLPERSGYMPQVVNTHTLDRVLVTLLETGAIDTVKGGHWSVGNSYRPDQTLYLASSAKASLAALHDQRERDAIKDRAEDQATDIILTRYRKQWREERDMIIASVTPPDHASLWEEAPDPEDD